MLKRKKILALAVALLSCGGALWAQGTPPDATGRCKDGSYTQAKEKSGACRGHQGIKEWYAATAAPAAVAAVSGPSATSTAAKPAPPAATSPSSPPSAVSTSKKMSPRERAAATPQAAGAGPGLVWFNADSKVYHCPGTTYYGKTKQGKYMSEADAKAQGGHPDHDHPCAK